MFLALSPISFGFASLATAALASLVALHHLRIQPTRRPVATLIFWRASARPQRAQVPWSRTFTHPKTFILLASILLLTAAALTADRWGYLGNTVRRDVIVIDDGIAMSADDGARHLLLRRATNAAEEDLEHMSDGPALISAAAQPVLLSQGDESDAVIRRRLNLIPALIEASASELALNLAGSILGIREGEIYWYTAQDNIPNGLPAELVKRVKLRHVSPAAAVAIVGVTFDHAIDDASRGALKISLRGQSNYPVTVEVHLGDETAMTRSAVITEGRAEITLADLTADGRSLRVYLQNAPGPAAYHEAAFRLPDERPITFRFMGDVPVALKMAALVQGTEATNAQVVVVGPGTLIPIDTSAAIVVVGDGPSVPAGDLLQFASGTPFGQSISLEGSVAVGPALATPGAIVLKAGAATMASFDQTPSRRTLYLSQGLITEGADLPRRAAFPVMIGRLCNALVGRTTTDPVVGHLREALDPLWSRLPDASFTSSSGTFADQLPANLTLGTNENAIDMGRVISRHIRWTQVVLAIAFVLTAIESLLFAFRKIV